jgi:hypothetical protein
MMRAIQPMARLLYTNNIPEAVMIKAKSQRFDRLLASSPGRVTLVMLTVMVAAGALTLLFGLALKLPFFLLSALVLTSLAMIAALSARVLLRNYTRALRLFSALVALLGGLLIIGFITRGAVGVNFTEPSSSPNWASLMQFIGSGLVTWLMLQAWTKPIRLKENGSSDHKKIKAQNPRQFLPAIRMPQIKMPRIRIPYSFPNIKGIGKILGKYSWLSQWRSNHESLPEQQVRLKTSAPKHLSKNHQLNRRLEPVKLVGIEEHNCPFCLEPVIKKDPRGLKICSSCKTWHHADCWDMTGECQVPHLQ